MSNDWREHNGGPQPVGDDVWVERKTDHHWMTDCAPAEVFMWDGVFFNYRILNQHLIDAARMEGILLGLKAAATTVCRAEIEAARELAESGDSHCPAEGRLSALAEATDLIRALDPETIAREGLTKPAQSDLPPSSSDTIAREAVLDQLTREAQADNMGYDND